MILFYHLGIPKQAKFHFLAPVIISRAIRCLARSTWCPKTQRWPPICAPNWNSSQNLHRFITNQNPPQGKVRMRRFGRTYCVRWIDVSHWWPLFFQVHQYSLLYLLGWAKHTSHTPILRCLRASGRNVRRSRCWVWWWISSPFLRGQHFGPFCILSVFDEEMVRKPEHVEKKRYIRKCWILNSQNVLQTR